MSHLRIRQAHRNLLPNARLSKSDGQFPLGRPVTNEHEWWKMECLANYSFWLGFINRWSKMSIDFATRDAYLILPDFALKTNDARTNLFYSGSDTLWITSFPTRAKVNLHRASNVFNFIVQGKPWKSKSMGKSRFHHPCSSRSALIEEFIQGKPCKATEFSCVLTQLHQRVYPWWCVTPPIPIS